MKTLFVCAFALLCTVTLFAQEQKEVQALPELQEWYSWKGGSGIVSYLPDFDSVGGGRHAITQGRGYDSPTWYNRYPFDTTNHFTWTNEGAYYIVYGDFNGDGIRDYWTVNDFVYRGIKKGAPPSQIPDTNYFLGEYRGYKWIADYNGDGYDDMLQQWNNSPCTNCPLFRVVWGGKDLKKLKQSTVGNFTDMKSAKMLGVLQNESKQWRVVSYEANELQPGNEVIFLYSLTITPSDIAPKLALTKLDEIRKSGGEGRVFEPCCNYLYWNKRTNNNFLILTGGIKQGDTKAKFYGYKVSNDKFIQVTDNSIGGQFWSYLEGSVDGDIEEDYTGVVSETVDNVKKYKIVVFSGNPLENNTPRLQAYVPKCNDYEYISFIGDVNGDGIGDIAYSCTGDLKIFLGLDWRTVDIGSSIIYGTFTIHQNEPNPVKKDRKTMLPISLKKSGNYTLQLYNVQGIKLKELFNGFLNEGEIKIPLDVSGLPAGMYIIKMSNGTLSRERAIIIGE